MARLRSASFHSMGLAASSFAVGPDLACYLPDKKTRPGGETAADESLLGGFPAVNEQTATFYDIQEVCQGRV